jgi:tetratricopeptide (TPR) repeat protein
MAQQDWAGAAKALESAIEINPRFPKFHYALSRVYRKMGKAAESEREMAAYRKLSEQPESQRPLDTAGRPHPEADNPAGGQSPLIKSADKERCQKVLA